MSTVAVSITVVWVLQRQQWAVIVLCLSVGLSLPPLNPLWPWPAGAGMWGAWDSGTAAVSYPGARRQPGPPGRRVATSPARVS